MQDLYADNYKTLVEEIKGDPNDWRDIPCPWIRRVTIAKMLVQIDLRFNLIPIKVSANVFIDIGKLTLKFMWKGKGHRIAKTTLKNKNKVGIITLPGIKAYYKTTVVRTVWYWG